jgi:hypothetical protein
MFPALVLVAVAQADASAAPPRPESAEMAHILGIERMVQELSNASSGSDASTLRADLAGRVLEASFEVDSAISEIAEEQSALVDVSEAIQSSRDARVGVLNLAAGVFAAGAAVGTGMALNSNTATAGTWVTTVTSGIGAVLAIYAATMPNRGAPPLRTRTNLLAPLLDRPLVAGSYPQTVLRYLASVAPGDTIARKERLVSDWEKLGRISRGNSPAERERIDRLCQPVPTRSDVELDLLQDRRLMLGDVRARVATMKQGLRALLEEIRPLDAPISSPPATSAAP